mmetsp:Transcript_4179/g.12977  ORF Transcript_4179/g.12977 Transcript_4179/m.12977 type:complete len:208 (-) Transcript_4179:91-714(-)|eukprot:CAMPEP_0198654956 /NCGR_PEP_ID=MMETSP1467-20131203/8053_1 /TAXON_ID=1462469 /ORGANISM="unid. sp., Strain CCMP2135" /LENGTH=207 /DNA_ID=CAMNT_0044390955 /DNA_START=94 /DNA_END=717 /DNA_ORIENTATION=+
MSAAERRRSGAQATQKKRREEVVDSRRGLESSSSSILERLGPAPAPLTRVVAKNIGANVSAQDVRALFATAGPVTRVAAVLEGGAATYEIDFHTAESARRALYEYDKRTLDGRPMSLSLTSGPSAVPSRPRNGAAALFKAAVQNTRRSFHEDDDVDVDDGARDNGTSVVLDVSTVLDRPRKKAPQQKKYLPAASASSKRKPPKSRRA